MSKIEEIEAVDVHYLRAVFEKAVAEHNEPQFHHGIMFGLVNGMHFCGVELDDIHRFISTAMPPDYPDEYIDPDIREAFMYVRAKVLETQRKLEAIVAEEVKKYVGVNGGRTVN